MRRAIPPYTTGQKLIFCKGKEKKEVIFCGEVTMLYQRRFPKPEVVAAWCTGYFTGDPHRGVFIIIDDLFSPYEENEFGLEIP